MAKKKKPKIRNYVLAVILKNDPERLRTRTVKPEKGKGRKDRPRNNKWDVPFDFNSQIILRVKDKGNFLFERKIYGKANG